MKFTKEEKIVIIRALRSLRAKSGPTQSAICTALINKLMETKAE